MFTNADKALIAAKKAEYLKRSGNEISDELAESMARSYVRNRMPEYMEEVTQEWKSLV